MSLTKGLLINDTLTWTSCAFLGSISFHSISRKEISTQIADLTASHSSSLAISSASLAVIWDTFIVVPSGNTHSPAEAFTWISQSWPLNSAAGYETDCSTALVLSTSVAFTSGCSTFSVSVTSEVSSSPVISGSSEVSELSASIASSASAVSSSSADSSATSVESSISVATSISSLSSETGSSTTVSTTVSETESSFSLTKSVAYTRGVTTLCHTKTNVANIDKNLFMFLWI